MYREFLMALNWGVAEAIYGESFWICSTESAITGLKKISKKSCRFLVIWARVDRSTERATRTMRMRVYQLETL